MAHAAKAMIGINLATVAASVKNLEVFKPAIFIKLSKTIKVILRTNSKGVKAGKVMTKSRAKPAAIADQAMMVTTQPRKPTLNPMKSPKAALEYWKAPPFLLK